MNDRSRSSDVLWRLAGDYYAGRSAEQAGGGQTSQAQHIPINVYETDEDIVLVAPMPGVEAENIDIEVLGTTVTLRSSLRGEGQRNRRYLVHEWTYGPYERSIELSVDVDAEHANASHGNGVLVLSLPKATRSRAIRVPLSQVSAQEARQEGHSGHHTTRHGLEGQP
jgi:HSP20 family protein